VDSQRSVTMIIEAAAEVAQRNYDALAVGKGCPVTRGSKTTRL
jgi:hypothetical protein